MADHSPPDPDPDPRPRPPEPPDPRDCCGEGCVPCVFDTYDEALERYRDALAAWQARHPQAPGDRSTSAADDR